MLISIKDAPDLYSAFYSNRYEDYLDLYNKYEMDGSVKKTFIRARDLADICLPEQYETGRLYSGDSYQINHHTPHKDGIYSSNLCVAPETEILTDVGYLPIGELENTKVNVWNGDTWSEVLVQKTGENQKLLHVETDSGYSLDCTPYHKFYIFNGYGKPYKEVRAHELKPNDKLCKFDTPVVYGDLELSLDKAYINGFYSGDGCLAPQGQRVYLYHDKRSLAPLFGDEGWTIQEQYKRQYKHYKDLKPKFFVPSADYSVESRLEWLAGYLDADGCIYRNGINEAITASSVELEFLKSIQMMLQTLGVVSKIKVAADEGYKILPKNDGTGEVDSFWCQTVYRLLISSGDSQHLLQLGLKLHRLKIERRAPQRESKQFIKIVSVEDQGRTDDTFCFNEPLKHLGMFNGLLTGQCLEITLPTKPYHSVRELYEEFSSEWAYITFEDNSLEVIIDIASARWALSNVKEGSTINGKIVKSIQSKNEIALCNIAGVNLHRDFTDEEYLDICYYLLRVVDYVILNSEYTFPNVKYSAAQRMNAGIGLTNFAYELARNGLYYSSKSGKKHAHLIAERHWYMLARASLKISKERGVAPWMFKSKLSEGWSPLDTYCRAVDGITDFEYKYDHEALRKDIIENGGLAHSSLVAHMPCESSSQVLNSVNGLYPIRRGKIVKTDGANVNVSIAPHFEELQWNYEIAWDIDTKHLVDHYAIFQKWADQSISADFYHDFTKEGNGLTKKKLYSDFLYKIKMGLKTQYYTNSKTNSESEGNDTSAGCGSGGCSL